MSLVVLISYTPASALTSSAVFCTFNEAIASSADLNADIAPNQDLSTGSRRELDRPTDDDKQQELDSFSRSHPTQSIIHSIADVERISDRIEISIEIGLVGKKKKKMT